MNGKLKRDRIYRVKTERESIRIEWWECAYKGNRGRRIGEEGITEIKWGRKEKILETRGRKRK